MHEQDTIPDWLSWISYLSHLYYAFLGLSINNFAGRTGWTCDGPPGATCLITGDEILTQRLNFNPGDMWVAWLGLGLLIFGYNAVGYLLLKYKKERYLPLTPAKPKAA